MRWQLGSSAVLALLVAATVATATTSEEEDTSDRDKRQSPYYTAALPVRPGPTYKPQLQQPTQQQPRFPAAAFSVAPQPFRSSPVDDSDADEVDRNAVSPTPSYLLTRPQPTTPSSQYRSQTPQPHQQQQQASRSRPNNQDYRRPPQQSTQGQRTQFQPQQQLTEEELAELEEDEKEEPDRLTQLLPESKFTCHNKNTGYYADEGLNCEVFHYCQDSARHSWICPEGFLFHQVHLICMPPSSDNICKQSSQFHFVNDYLYRPINEDEVQRKPNVTLRYADRYYPENYYPEEAEETHQPAPQVVRRPAPQQNQNYQLQRPVQQVRQASNTNQVFHSPEEVNIPLQHRRPQQPISQAEDEDY
ncbi:uncharacterized protein LOC111048853 [Nilaparvata lugens]|uniref:Cuticular protein n=1 Tax=Nilaparvata lugens TaxID=108931 RepID=A0A2S1ZS32_NILLU|nr:uncharacterized protein LOC111048853 [Nilaparvata lugens]AWK28261.1 cuticular protein [Nilaparvata lugens]